MNIKTSALSFKNAIFTLNQNIIWFYNKINISNRHGILTSVYANVGYHFLCLWRPTIEKGPQMWASMVEGCQKKV
jgi:hypothetical protein